MQENENCDVLVHMDLLLQENLSEKLREFVSKLDFTKVELYDEFNYDLDADAVVIIRQPPHPDYSNLNLICYKSNRGYILTDLENLKKILSL